MPNVAEYDNEKEWMAACVPVRVEEGDAQDQAVAACLNIWRNRNKAANALKAVRSTDEELVVANYIVLFGGRDLEGVASPAVNADGSKGETFAPDVELESAYTKAGALYVDFEHRKGEAGDAPLGIVDWKTARRDEKGWFVERVLSRRNKYVQFLEGLIAEGLIGTSSEADPKAVEKRADGTITRWPLVRDTLTVQPMEPRMLTENQLQAFKALGIDPAREHTEAQPEPEPEAGPEASADAVPVAKAKVRAELLLQGLTEV